MLSARPRAAKSGLKWRAEIVFGHRKFHVGSFASEAEALAVAADEAARVDAGTSLLLDAGLLNQQAFADSIGVKKGTIKHWIHDGLPVRREGSILRIVPSAAMGWINKNRPDTIAMHRQSTVYLCERDTDHAIKCGWSANLIRRMRELTKAGYPVSIFAALPGEKSVEIAFHNRFATRRVEGEWFAITRDEAVAALKEVA